MEYNLTFKKYGCEFNYDLLCAFTREFSPNALVALEVIWSYNGSAAFDKDFCEWFITMYLCIDIDFDDVEE